MRNVKKHPTLVFPNFSLPFILETDESKERIGAVLAQKQSDGAVRPIVYASIRRTLQGLWKH